MLLTILALMALIVVIIVLLPQFSGLTKVRYQPKRRGLKQQEPKSTGYNAPQRAQEKPKLMDSLKKNFNYTRESVPLKLELTNTESSSLRRRQRAKVDTDPNNFDFDIDELIDEDNEQEAQELRQRLAKSVEEVEDLA